MHPGPTAHCGHGTNFARAEQDGRGGSTKAPCPREGLALARGRRATRPGGSSPGEASQDDGAEPGEGCREEYVDGVHSSCDQVCGQAGIVLRALHEDSY